jgi:HAD superfamily hydrolase (TIGR01549 family)
MVSPIVIFDLDGTLIDSKNQIYEAMALARKSLGLGDVNKEFIEQHLGLPVRQLIPEQDLSQDFVDGLVLEFRRFLKIAILKHNEAFPGAIELIDVLRANGLKIGIATSKPQLQAEMVVHNSPLKGLIDFIQGTDNFPPKPNPEVIKRVLETFVNPPAIMIGDRIEDLEAATASGIPSVGIAQSAHDEEKLTLHGARLTYADMQEAFKDSKSIMQIIKTAV